jgi:hypothetical protein
MRHPIQARFIGSNTVSANGVTVTAVDPVQSLCRTLVKQGYDPQSSLKIWKGTKPYLVVRCINNPDDHFKIGGKAA